MMRHDTSICLTSARLHREDGVLRQQNNSVWQYDLRETRSFKDALTDNQRWIKDQASRPDAPFDSLRDFRGDLTDFQLRDEKDQTDATKTVKVIRHIGSDAEVSKVLYDNLLA